MDGLWKRDSVIANGAMKAGRNEMRVSVTNCIGALRAVGNIYVWVL